jgi:hypothetical protein
MGLGEDFLRDTLRATLRRGRHRLGRNVCRHVSSKYGSVYRDAHLIKESSLSNRLEHLSQAKLLDFSCTCRFISAFLPSLCPQPSTGQVYCDTRFGSCVFSCSFMLYSCRIFCHIWSMCNFSRGCRFVFDLRQTSGCQPPARISSEIYVIAGRHGYCFVLNVKISILCPLHVDVVFEP